MRSSIATYRESLSRLAGEVDEAAADEVSAPARQARGGDSAPTLPSSGRRRRYSRPGFDAAEPDEVRLPSAGTLSENSLANWVEQMLLLRQGY
jgi:hypothetical protein